MFFLTLFFLFFTSPQKAMARNCGEASLGLKFQNDCEVAIDKDKIKDGFVIIINQWHPGPKLKTLDIQKSKLIPHFENQYNIYKKSLGYVNHINSQVIIAEGCEGEITENYKKKFYGWGYNELNKLKDTKEYEAIMAHIPLKLKVKLKDKIKVICGDDDELIEKNSLAFSELRGFSGYYVRLKQNQGKNAKLFDRYANSLIPNYKKKNIDPVSYARSESLKYLEQAKSYIEKRNSIFLKALLKYQKKNPILIVGGLHSNGLVQALKKNNVPYVIFYPKGYNHQDIKLFDDLKTLLSD